MKLARLAAICALSTSAMASVYDFIIVGSEITNLQAFGLSTMLIQ
jgi:hypothetical protein